MRSSSLNPIFVYLPFHMLEYPLASETKYIKEELLILPLNIFSLYPVPNDIK